MEIPVCNTCNSSKPNSYVLVCTGCASKIKESQTTAVQQLKAEISALATKFIESDKPQMLYEDVYLVIKELQKLSAV